jgi:heme/copper-type cytochrome/quinol oxidase subunit 2
MIRKALFSLAVVGVALVAVASGSARPVKDSFDLKGEVYPSFKIEMTNAAGRTLKTVKAGTYRIKIEDKSSLHDFHLTGPGVNKATSVTGVRETFWTVRLKAGTYRFVCDMHASQMHGSFRVTG